MGVNLAQTGAKKKKMGVKIRYIELPIYRPWRPLLVYKRMEKTPYIMGPHY